jgi:uncharacterized protein YqhQ
LTAPFFICMTKTKPIYYGGQAVIEGVMMRGPQNVAVAVRRPDGQIDVKDQPLARLYTGRLRDTPFIRGFIILIETLVLGVNALLHSAQVAAAEEGEEISPGMLWGTLAVGIVFAVAIFFVAPLLIANYLIFPYVESEFLGNLIEGMIRIGIFILYLYVVGLMPDIRRVFSYHGAEHKVVNAYEAGMPLELEQVKRYSTAHTRCGTSFLLIVLVIAIAVFSLLGRPDLWLMIISRIVLLPVIAALGYECVRVGAAHANNRIVRGILTPGLLLQSMTTREPDDGQIEIALSALKKVIDDENAAKSAQSAL